MIRYYLHDEKYDDVSLGLHSVESVESRDIESSLHTKDQTY